MMAITPAYHTPTLSDATDFSKLTVSRLQNRYHLNKRQIQFQHYHFSDESCLDNRQFISSREMVVGLKTCQLAKPLNHWNH